jgi:predicted PurR-regulated permease PerM
MNRPERSQASPAETSAPAAATDPVHAADSFVGRVATVILLAGVAALALILLLLGVRILLAAFAGVLLGVLLHALGTALTRHTPLSYGWALGVVVVVMAGLLSLAVWLVAAQIADQADELGAALPTLLDGVREFARQYGWGRWLLEQSATMSAGQLAMENGSGVLSALSDWSTYIVLAVFVGLFAAANPGLYRRGIASLFPLRHRRRVDDLLGETGHTLRWWLIGQAASMVIIGVSSGLVLWAFGVPLALALGLLVGLLGFIPYLGPIIGTVPVALMAATQGADTLLYVLLGYTAVQMLEGYVAVPLIHERTVYLPPLLTIISQVLLGTVVGILGFALATPLAAVLLVVTRFYRTDVLGDTASIASAAHGD